MSVPRGALVAGGGCDGVDRTSVISGRIMGMGEAMASMSTATGATMTCSRVVACTESCGRENAACGQESEARFHEVDVSDNVEHGFSDLVGHADGKIVDRVGESGLGSRLNLLYKARQDYSLKEAHATRLDHSNNYLDFNLDQQPSGPTISAQCIVGNVNNVSPSLSLEYGNKMHNDPSPQEFLVESSLLPMEKCSAPALPVRDSRSQTHWRRGRGSRGGRRGTGVFVSGILSTSGRFLQLARGVGKRVRSAPPAQATSSASGGLMLHVELRNLNALPEDELANVVEGDVAGRDNVAGDGLVGVDDYVAMENGGGSLQL